MEDNGECMAPPKQSFSHILYFFSRFFLLIYRDAYITSAAWVANAHNQISIVWMNRAQNISMVSTCFSPDWICVEVIKILNQIKTPKFHCIAIWINVSVCLSKVPWHKYISRDWLVESKCLPFVLKFIECLREAGEFMWNCIDICLYDFFPVWCLYSPKHSLQ